MSSGCSNYLEADLKDISLIREIDIIVSRMNRHSFGHKFKGYDHTEETESTKFHQSEQLPNLTNEPPHSEKGQAGTVKAKAIEPDHKEQLHHLFNHIEAWVPDQVYTQENIDNVDPTSSSDKIDWCDIESFLKCVSTHPNRWRNLHGVTMSESNFMKEGTISYTMKIWLEEV